jgi:hypothetical protein
MLHTNECRNENNGQRFIENLEKFRTVTSEDGSNRGIDRLWLIEF